MKIGASLLVAILSLPAAAHAGGYVAAGVGSSPELGGELEQHLQTDGHSAGRVAVGHGIGPISVEAALAGFGLHGVAPNGEWLDGEALSLGLSLKGQIGLFGPLDGYGRAGVERTFIRADMMETFDGEGYLLGAGLELALPLVFAAAVWVEYDREMLDLAQDQGSITGTADTLLAGVRVGL
jgi:hypothetical protein